MRRGVGVGSRSDERTWRRVCNWKGLCVMKIVWLRLKLEFGKN